MNVHWLAIDRKVTSYENIKKRHVVAQGWGGVGDIRTLIPLVIAGGVSDYATFAQTVTALEKHFYGDISHGGRVLWDLLSLRAGDLIVAAEGTTVRGICQIKEDATLSYRWDSQYLLRYAHTIGFPATWIDWNTAQWGVTPRTPRHGIQGVRRLRNESDRIKYLWSIHSLQPTSKHKRRA